MSLSLEERLGTDIRRLYVRLMAVKAAALRTAGVTVPQYTALYLLGEAPGISGAALARECQVTPQSMAAVLANLEAAGLVERRPHQWHRNVIETRLTDAGRRTLAIADEAASAVEQRLLDRYTASELGTLRKLLARTGDELSRIETEQRPAGGKRRSRAA